MEARTWQDVAEEMNRNVIARAEVLARRMRPRYNIIMVNNDFRVHHDRLIERYGTDGRIAASYAGQSDAEATQILMSMAGGPSQGGAAAGSVASGSAVAGGGGTQNSISDSVLANRPESGERQLFPRTERIKSSMDMSILLNPGTDNNDPAVSTRTPYFPHPRMQPSNNSTVSSAIPSSLVAMEAQPEQDAAIWRSEAAPTSRMEEDDKVQIPEVQEVVKPNREVEAAPVIRVEANHRVKVMRIRELLNPEIVAQPVAVTEPVAVAQAVISRQEDHDVQMLEVREYANPNQQVAVKAEPVNRQEEDDEVQILDGPGQVIYRRRAELRPRTLGLTQVASHGNMYTSYHDYEHKERYLSAMLSGNMNVFDNKINWRSESPEVQMKDIPGFNELYDVEE
jgi:hypothetical protein